MFRKLSYSFILAMLITSLSFGAELRKLGSSDLLWGPYNTTWTSPQGATVTYLPRYFSTDAFSDNLTLYGNDLITRGPWVDVRAYGTFSTSASGTVNMATLQAACDNATVSNIKTVLIPTGNFNITGTLDTKGAPLIGYGSNMTNLFPTTSVPAIKMTLSQGVSGGFSVNYTNVGATNITSNAIGIQLWAVANARLYDIEVWRGYNGIEVKAGSGYGYTWQLEIDHYISAYNKYWAVNIESSSDSTTVKISNSHVFAIAANDNAWSGGWTTYKGFYSTNLTTLVLSNCSMDGGDGSANGSVITFTSGHQLVIDTFHLESFTQTAGGTSSSPVYFSGGAFIQNFFTVSYNVAVGAGIDAYLFWGTYPSSVVLGSYSALSPGVTSGTAKIGNWVSCQSAVVLSMSGGVGTNPTTLDRSMFNMPANIDDASTKIRLMKDIYYQEWVREVGSHLKADNTAKTLINLPLSSTFYGGVDLYGSYNPSAELTVVGYGGISPAAESFIDKLLVLSTYSAFSQVKVVSSDNTASASTRTYAISGDNVTLQLSGTTSYYTVTNGKLLYPYYMP